VAQLKHPIAAAVAPFKEAIAQHQIIQREGLERVST
jgi:hypothetical protein